MSESRLDVRFRRIPCLLEFTVVNIRRIVYQLKEVIARLRSPAALREEPSGALIKVNLKRVSLLKIALFLESFNVPKPNS